MKTNASLAIASAAAEFQASALYIKLRMGGIMPNEEGFRIAMFEAERDIQAVMREAGFASGCTQPTFEELRKLYLIVAHRVIAKLEAA